MKILTIPMLIWYVLCCSMLAFSSPYATEIGDYTINHAIFPSLDLNAEMADKFDITRGQNIALVVVSISRINQLSAGSLVAKVFGTTKDLLSRKRNLQFKYINAGQDSHYYIATVKYTNHDTQVFDFSVQLDGQADVLQARVTKVFN